MITEVRERVEVAVLFGKGEKVRPVWFVWNGKKIRIQEITYRWREQEGDETFYHFSVADGTTLYELSYAGRRLLWELRAVEVEG
jgi:hypothetical protein